MATAARHASSVANVSTLQSTRRPKPLQLKLMATPIMGSKINLSLHFLKFPSSGDTLSGTARTALMAGVNQCEQLNKTDGSKAGQNRLTRSFVPSTSNFHKIMLAILDSYCHTANL